MTPKTKEFDCIKMKRDASLRMHETLKGKTREQRLEYWRQQSEAFQALYPKVRIAEADSR